MKAFSQTLGYLLPALYIVVLYVYYNIFVGKKKKQFHRTTPFLIVLGVIHIIELVTRHLVLKTMPLSTAHDALSFLAFSILIVYMIIELSLNNRGSGLFILSFAFLLELISSINMSWQPEMNELLSRPTFAVHASLSIMGYTALSVCAIYALMYIMQNRNMKKRRFGIIYDQLPPLTYLESMSIRSVAIGIILLGMGIFHGHIQAGKVLGEFWLSDIKVIVMDTIWILYLIFYIVSRFFKWRGRWMAYLSVFGFLTLMIGGILIMFLTESFHKFY